MMLVMVSEKSRPKRRGKEARHLLYNDDIASAGRNDHAMSKGAFMLTAVQLP